MRLCVCVWVRDRGERERAHGHIPSKCCLVRNLAVFWDNAIMSIVEPYILSPHTHTHTDTHTDWVSVTHRPEPGQQGNSCDTHAHTHTLTHTHSTGSRRSRVSEHLQTPTGQCTSASHQIFSPIKRSLES